MWNIYIFKAAAFGYEKMVNEIIKLNANVNSVDLEGCTALIFGKPRISLNL